MSPQELLDLIYDYKRMRENFEPMSYMSRKAYEGNHFVYWDKELKKISTLPIKQAASMFNELPEISTQTDKFENFLLSTNFTFTVKPKLLSDQEAGDISIMLSSLARDYYSKWKVKKKQSNLIKNALYDNVSFIETAINDAGDDVEVRIWDFFDILFNPSIKDWDKQRVIIKVSRKNKNDIKNSKLYTMPDNPNSGDLFFSWKDVYEAQKYLQFADLHKDEILLFECFILTKDGLNIKTIDASKNVYRDDKYPSIKTIPIKPFAVYSGDLYQPSFIFRMIPVQRSIDLIWKRIEELILRLAKGGWVVQEEEDIAGSMNEELGQLIRYATVKPESVQFGQMPPFLMEFLNLGFKLAERYGVPPLLAGNLPTQGSGLRSNSMIESLVSQAYQNNSSTIENLRYVITETLQDTFKFLYEIWQTPKSLTLSEIPDRLSGMKFISEKYAGLYKDENSQTIAIPSQFGRFDVEIDNAMGYTVQAQKDTAMMLFEKNIIGAETVKKIFKVGASGYLMEAENPPMYKSPEFKNLINNMPNLTPEQQAAVIKTLETIGGQGGGQTTPSMPGSIPTPSAPTMPMPQMPQMPQTSQGTPLPVPSQQN